MKPSPVKGTTKSQDVACLTETESRLALSVGEDLSIVAGIEILGGVRFL